MKKKKYKLGWKAVTLFGGRASSWLSGSPSCVDYFFSKPSKPYEGCGPLCVFKKKEDAVKFAQVFSHRPHREHEEVVFPCAYLPSKIKKVWRASDPSNYRKLNDLPDGKALADEVILLKEKYGG